MQAVKPRARKHSVQADSLPIEPVYFAPLLENEVIVSEPELLNVESEDANQMFS